VTILAGTTDFTEEEFRCKCGCGLLRMHPGFAEDLQALRSAFGRPMKVLSGCRCKAYNETVGGHPRSLHVGDFPAHADKGQEGCLAVDIEAVDGAYRGELFMWGWRMGFAIGWNAKRGFLHNDRRVLIGLPQTCFDY